jgi:hypothetical protein
MKKKFKRVLAETAIANLKDLQLTCKSTKCKDELHCFQMTKKSIKEFGKTGVCRDCGEGDIDWKRLFKKDINDKEFIVFSLQKELFRYAYWNSKIDSEAIENAKQTGLGNSETF